MLVYTLLRESEYYIAGSLYAIEIADLTTNTTVRTLQLGQHRITNFAVSTNGQRIYLCAQGSQALLEISAYTGNTIRTFPIPGVSSCLLSTDQKTLFAVGSQGIFSFDLASGIQLGHIPNNDVFSGELAINKTYPSRVGFPTYALSHPFIYLYLDEANIPGITLMNTSDEEYYPNLRLTDFDLVYTSAKALLWDKGNGAMMQVDPATDKWNGSLKIQTATDSTFGENLGALSYSKKSNRAYTVTGKFPSNNGTRRLAIMDPDTGAFQLANGFNGEPARSAIDPTGANLVIAVHNTNGQDTLDIMDVKTNVYTRSVYTYSKDTAGLRVVEMHILQQPTTPPQKGSIHKGYPVRILGQVPADGGGAIVVGPFVIPVPPPTPWMFTPAYLTRISYLASMIDLSEEMKKDDRKRNELLIELLENEIAALKKELKTKGK